MGQDMENLMIQSESLSGWCVITIEMDQPQSLIRQIAPW
jgi:hypothetical protein